MILNSFFAFLHFVAAIGVIVTVVYERITLNRNLTFQDARKIQKADSLYGFCALMVLIIGFLRVFYFEKGSNFYFASPFFLVKMGAFILVGLLSIYPTIRFIKWRKFIKENKAPELSDSEYGRISWLINLEIIGLLVVLFSASLMAKGVGF